MMTTMNKDIFHNLRAIGKVTPLGRTKYVNTMALLKDPIFRLSRWLGVFYLTDDLKISYRVIAIGSVFFVLLQLERFYRIIYQYPGTKNEKGITILILAFYDINWFLALLGAGGLRQSLKKLSTISGKLEVDYRTTWIFLIPFVLITICRAFLVFNAPKRAVYEVLNIVVAAPTLLMPLQYAVLARHCAKAFEALHQRLVESDDRQLERLAAIHCKLCQLSDMINHHYGPVILVTVSLFIALSMVFGYIITSEAEVPAMALVRSLSRLASTLIAFLCTIYATSSVREKADQFNSTLKNILVLKGSTDDVNMIFAGLIYYTVILLSFSGKGYIKLIHPVGKRESYGCLDVENIFEKKDTDKIALLIVSGSYPASISKLFVRLDRKAPEGILKPPLWMVSRVIRIA